LKAGGNRGISLFFHFYWDIGGGGDSSCFTESGVGNLEKVRFKFLALIPLLLGGFCAFFALYILAIILREGFYSF